MNDFFSKTDLSRKDAEGIISETLNKCDDGELYLENSKSESIVLDDNKIKSSIYNSDLGYGLRAVTGEDCGLRLWCRRNCRGLRRWGS